MLNDIQKELINQARRVQGYRKLDYENYAGYVGVAMLGKNGKIYTGIDIGVTCGIGFCAEHTCIAQMIMEGETEIIAMCAVGENTFFPPCGRCRELICQINRNNANTQVILGYDKIVTIRDLLPYQFWEYQDKSDKFKE